MNNRQQPKSNTSIKMKVFRVASGLELMGGLTTAVKESWKRISDLWDATRRHRNPHNETFQEAVSRLCLTETTLQQRQNEFQFRATSWLVMAVISLGFLVYTPWSVNPISHAWLSSGVLLISTAKSMAWQFRVSQIHDRELYDFTDWLLGKRVRK